MSDYEPEPMRYSVEPGEDEHRRVRSKTLLMDLRDVARRNGRPPKTEYYRKWGSYDPMTHIERFGSWANAIYLAGMNPKDIERDAGRMSRVSPNALINDIRHVDDKVAGPPLLSEYNEMGEYSRSTVTRQLGLWSEIVVDILEYGEKTYMSKVKTANRGPGYSRGDIAKFVHDLMEDRTTVPSQKEIQEADGPSLNAMCFHFEDASSMRDILEIHGYTWDNLTKDHLRANLPEGIPNRIRERVIEVVDELEIDPGNLTHKTVQSLAAMALWIANCETGGDLSMNYCAEVFGVSMGGIHSRMKRDNIQPRQVA